MNIKVVFNTDSNVGKDCRLSGWTDVDGIVSDMGPMTFDDTHERYDFIKHMFREYKSSYIGLNIEFVLNGKKTDLVDDCLVSI
jgi:hypothetical protein